MKGKKLQGEWFLIKTGNDWLLIKKEDIHSSTKYIITKSEPYSIKSGKRVEEITSKDGLISDSKKLGWKRTTSTFLFDDVDD